MNLSQAELLALARQAGVDAHVKTNPNQTLLTDIDGKNLTNQLPPFNNNK